MFNELRRMDEHNKKLNQDLENINNNQKEVKNIITEIIGINSKLDHAD